MRANGGAPDLISAASKLVADTEGSKRERPPRRRPCTATPGAVSPSRATEPVKGISTTFDRHGKLPSVAPGEVSELAEGARLEIA